MYKLYVVILNELINFTFLAQHYVI